MSLLNSLYSGVSGLTTTSQELSIVGDNIANSNTIGFKASRAVFEEILGQNLPGSLLGLGETGLGARLQAVQKVLTQGALTTTGLATDMALQGRGFFIVKSDTGSAVYTRAGQFTIDENGVLTNLAGMEVQGFTADQAGNMGGLLGDIQIGEATSSPQATSEIILKGNLDPSAAIETFDIADADGTSSFSQSMTVFDSLGTAVEVTVFFNRTASGEWEYHATTDGENQEGGTPGTLVEISSGSLSYDTEGKLVGHTVISDNFLPVGANQPQSLGINFGEPFPPGTGLEGMTQFAGTSAIDFVNQNGFEAGSLANLSINEEGVVVGAFSNGQTRELAQIGVADFSAPDRLERLGNNLFQENDGTGTPNIGGANSGGRGRLIAGSLEQSNVELASEFIRMIVAQRGFQANSKTVQTSDQLLSELIQLKR
jgi:flagellar hook protein FlgE